MLADIVAELARRWPGLEPERRRVQIALTPLDEGGRDAGETEHFRADAEYFYPASTVKVLGAVAALRAADARGVGLDEELVWRERPELAGLKEERGTVRGAVWAALVVSDNPAFNRLYDLVGHAEMQEALRAMGVPRARVVHRLADPRPLVEHRMTRAVARVSGGEVAAARRSGAVGARGDEPGVMVGNEHADPVTGVRVKAPLDFSERNAVKLMDLHRVMMAVARGEGLGLNAEGAALVRAACARMPAGAGYAADAYADDYAKPMLSGLRRVAPASAVEVVNKIGTAYGFMTDTAVIGDATRGVKFALSATIYANAGEVLGTDEYEYAAVARPWLADLGEIALRRARRG